MLKYNDYRLHSSRLYYVKREPAHDHCIECGAEILPDGSCEHYLVCVYSEK